MDFHPPALTTELAVRVFVALCQRKSSAKEGYSTAQTPEEIEEAKLYMMLLKRLQIESAIVGFIEKPL